MKRRFLKNRPNICIHVYIDAVEKSMKKSGKYFKFNLIDKG